MKCIDRITTQVIFNFGSVAYVGVNIYEGKSIEECIKLRDADIEKARINGKWIDIK